MKAMILDPILFYFMVSLSYVVSHICKLSQHISSIFILPLAGVAILSIKHHFLVYVLFHQFPYFLCTVPHTKLNVF